MTIENEYVLSFYSEITPLNQKNKVFLVRHIESGELFVKKIIAAYCAPVYDRLKNCNIAGVPRVIEAIVDDDQLYVIEEYIHGKSLAAIFDAEGPLPAAEVRNIALNLCTILINLHDLTPPIIHRDIKPSNLMLTNDGMLRLIDFDAAKNAVKDQKKDTHLLGTGGFAAPEQYGFGASDERTDIYGVGSTINYLLTGKLPNEELCGGPFEKIVRKCLSVDSVDRYQSAAELYSSIESYSDNTDIDLMLLGDISRLKAPDIFFPVGFRTRHPGRIAASLVLHSLSVYMALDFVEQTVYENLLWMLMVILSAAWFGNYLGIRSFVNASIKNVFLRISAIFLLWLGAMVMVVAFMPE